MSDDLRPGDEILFGNRPAYYVLVLRGLPRLSLRVRRGGPRGVGALIADIDFDHHPTRGEFASAIAALDGKDFDA